MGAALVSKGIAAAPARWSAQLCARRGRSCAPPVARVGEVERITPNSQSSRSIRRLHKKHETATLAHYLNLVTNDISYWRSIIPVRSTAGTSGILRTYVGAMHYG